MLLRLLQATILRVSRKEFMLHIEVLTYGNEFKDSQGKIYKVTSNFPDRDKILIELELVEPVEELIPEQ